MEVTRKSPPSRFGPDSTRRAHRGVTLVEFLVSLAVIVALALAALPALGVLLDQHRAAYAADRLAASLAMARSMASARRTELVLTPIGGNKDFGKGWALGIAGNTSRADEPPLSVVAMTDRCLSVTLRGTGGTAGAGGTSATSGVAGRQSLRLTPVGYSRTEHGGFFAATFQVRCHAAQRQVRLGALGRIRICQPGVDTDCD